MEQVASYVTGHFTERQKQWLHIKPLSDPPTAIIIHQTLTVTNRSDIRWQDFQPDILIIRSWRLHWIIIWMPNSLHWVLLIDHFLAGGFKDFLFSPLKLGKWSNLTHIFQMGWFNHQLVFTDWTSDFGTTFPVFETQTRCFSRVWGKTPDWLRIQSGYNLPSSQYGDISKWCTTYISSRIG